MYNSLKLVILFGQELSISLPTLLIKNMIVCASVCLCACEGV